MKLQEATKRETLHIAAGVLALSLVMNLVYLALGKWALPVLWGTLLGGVWAVVNFLLLGLTVQKMTANADEKRGKAWLQLSYSLRTLVTLGTVVLGFLLPCFAWVPVVLEIFFPRLTILFMQVTGKAGTVPAQTAEAQAQASVQEDSQEKE